jgi:predicted transcriptional regulator
MDAHLPAAELAVLEALWHSGPTTIRQLMLQLYPGGAAAEYATVQKLVERLEAKGCIRRDRSAFVHTVEASVARQQVIDLQLRDVAERLCEGSLTPLLMHLVQGATLSAAERAQLRKMLDSPPQKPAPKPMRRTRK